MTRKAIIWITLLGTAFWSFLSWAFKETLGNFIYDQLVRLLTGSLGTKGAAVIAAWAWPIASLLLAAAIVLLTYFVAFRHGKESILDRGSSIIPKPLASHSLNRTPIISFLVEAQNNGWRILSPNSQINEFAAAIRQAGRDGVLVFSGRPIKHNIFSEMIRDEPLRPIPADHWDEFRFDWTSAVQMRPKTFEIDSIATDNFPTLTSKWTHEKGYADLHVERSGALAWLGSSVIPPSVNNTDRSLLAISLPEAARILYENTRQTKMGALAEWDNSPERILDYYGVWIAQTRRTPLYGKRPPSTAIERIDPKEVKSMDIKGGAKELVSRYDKNSKYIELEIPKADFDRLLAEIKE